MIKSRTCEIKGAFAEMEQKLHDMWSSEEDSLFYYHSSEDRIVLSHALFWVMTQPLKGKIRQERFLLLLRQYEEEMLDDYLMDTEDFPVMLHYCMMKMVENEIKQEFNTNL